MEPSTDSTVVIEPQPKRGFFQSEDWLAILLGSLVLILSLLASYSGRAKDFDDRLNSIEKNRQHLIELRSQKSDSADEIKRTETDITKLAAGLYPNPLKPWLGKIGSWDKNPQDAFQKEKKSLVPGLAGVFVFLLVLYSLGTVLRGKPVASFIAGFIPLFLLAVLSYVLAGQNVIKYYNLEYALWAIVLGMVISNTIGTPKILWPALDTELYIKTGLVLLGAEILLSRLLVLGLPGICVSWVVTPITLITTYLFGQYVLRIPSKSLNMVISADMSVCGVSAAIATAAACRAKKEELSLAIGISLTFTVIMMVVMPGFIRVVGMNEVLAGAWLGGTIDSTGAVAAAGGMVGPVALAVAATVKMIQNILIGVVAFGVAVYWVTCVEKSEDGQRPGLIEVWKRFPKFVLGFIGASIVFSAIYSSGPGGEALTESAIGVTGEILRGWLFCLAFVSIGLESNFRQLAQYLQGGKALVLYVCGQTLNLALTLIMAWLMFEVVFPQAKTVLGK